jgi:hypothetical protein
MLGGCSAESCTAQTSIDWSTRRRTQGSGARAYPWAPQPRHADGGDAVEHNLHGVVEPAGAARLYSGGMWGACHPR